MATVNKFKIDFIGVAAPKCGSSWVAKVIEDHPQVGFSKIKEPNFFLTNNFFKSPLAKIFNGWQCENFYQYKKIFKAGEKIGEFSPSYLYDTTSANKIKANFPEVKIIIVLRNPADMLYSMYWFKRNSKFREYLPNTFEKSIEKDWFIERGKYSKYLKQFYNTFNKNDIKTIIFDDIIEKPNYVVSDLYKFLEINSSYIPEILNKKINPTMELKSINLHNNLTTVYNAVKKLKLEYLIHKLKFNKIYNKINRQEFKYPKMDISIKNKLLNIYKEEINLLENLINIDLSKWKI